MGENMREKIAAVVPVYNVAKYLNACVGSLLAQTRKLDTIILVDDGSTDESAGMCDDLARKHDSVVVIHKNNQGLGFARNTGLENVPADTDFVMFVDSDDWLDKDAVESLARHVDTPEVDCVTSGFVKRDNSGRLLFELGIEDGLWRGDEVRERLVPMVCGSSPAKSDSIPMSVCATLFRMSIIERENLRFVSEREVISEDFDFKVRYFVKCRKVRTVSDTKYNYRYNPRSLSTSYRRDRFKASLDFYSYGIRLLADLGCSEVAKSRLAKTLFIYVRSSIAQERKAVSGLSAADACSNISSMVQDGRLQSVIASYPVFELGWKQRAFIACVKRKMSRTLYFAAELGLLK